MNELYMFMSFLGVWFLLCALLGWIFGTMIRKSINKDDE